MLEGNLLENVILFALPLIASGIMQLLFNAIDMVVVGKYSGNASMAAVSSTGALINFFRHLSFLNRRLLKNLQKQTLLMYYYAMKIYLW